MKKSLKTEEIVNAYGILKDAKYQKLEDSDKVKVWKISRAMKSVATQYEEDRIDASKTFVTEEVARNLHKAQEYERKRNAGLEDLPMTDEEYQEYIKEFLKCKALVESALKESLEKETELGFEPLSEDAFGKLLASNDWSLSQADVLGFIVE